MLAALSLGAVLLGVAAGGLAASVISLTLSAILVFMGVAAGAEVGLVAGVVMGMVVGGWVSGARAVHSGRFHGAVTGLLLAFLIMVVARFGGSPAGAGTILWLGILSAVIGGGSGWLASKRRDIRS